MIRAAALWIVVTAIALSPAVFAEDETQPLAAEAPAAPAPAPARAQDIPVRQVVLFSSGVGYFEHFGSVTGEAQTELRFRTEQINDILKSLVLQDLDKGRVTTITYPSMDPLEKQLRSFQVDITENPSLAELLNQLRGARVTVKRGPETVSATILGVEKRQRPVDDKHIINEPVLNLITDGRIVSIPLEQIVEITFEDPALQDELTRALAALTQARDQEKKAVQIAFDGKGERRVRIGYVVQTPVWKTSYRLLLTGNSKPHLQGWAIVENQTDNDWNNVELALVSGRPISFVQDLYQPLYVSRPVFRPKMFAGLGGQLYEGGIPMTPPAGMAPPASRTGRAGEFSDDILRTPAVAQERAEKDFTTSIFSAVGADTIGELFQYSVSNVSLSRQRSAMIPIVADNLEIEKVSIYNAQVLPRNPLNGALLKNTTGKHLLAGPITVFESNSYAGDAVIDNLPPNQERLISYGVDLQVLVDSTRNRTDTSLMTGKIVRGVLELQHKRVATREYLTDNKSDAVRTLIIEHPVRSGWKLADTEKPVETTATHYRFRAKAPSGKPARFVVKEEMIQGQSVQILPAEIDQLLVYARAGEIPSKVREALARAIELRRNVSATQRQLDDRRARFNDVVAQQKHTSEMMKNLQQNTPLYLRLAGKMSDLQTDLEKLQSEIHELNDTVEQQRHELEEYLANLNVS